MLKSEDITPDLINQFWDKVLIPSYGDCWTWKLKPGKQGYGLFNFIKASGKSSTVSAHRASWEINIGPIPKGNGYHGTCVLHKYDNRLCVRPFHLFLGSNDDNVKDMVAKNRNAVGEKIKRNGLTSKSAQQIRLLFASGDFTQYDLASQFGINQSQISRVVHNKTWKHVK